MIRLLIIITILFNITSCGVKGPLYIPNEEVKEKPSDSYTAKYSDTAPSSDEYPDVE
jgi:predicted small lipoprotein YifL